MQIEKHQAHGLQPVGFFCDLIQFRSNHQDPAEIAQRAGF
jgi:hypothetical protein